jgi:hypothetical protein
MTRSMFASTSICAFQYKNYSRDEFHLEKINNDLRPYLCFNRLRRLVLLIEQKSDVARQDPDRWFATLLLRSVTQRNPAWCYFLLKRNAVDLVRVSN